MVRRAAVKKLEKYQSMRDFSKTAEPSGAKARAHKGNSFVIQKHAARRLHYDFRLELDGVLLSWSVPKGPSLAPTERRLAVRTEDHPLDYASFEGVIPQGQYGGGTVVVWDRGTWTPDGDAQEMMKKGRLTFTLDGEKLSGRWHLIKTKPQGKQEGWLLFKGRDDAANDELDIVANRPESVITGRTVEQIAEKPDRVWHSDRKSAKHKPAANQNELVDLVGQLPLGFKLTNLDKVLYPEQGITKGQLVAYFAVVAEHMLPHVANRPLTIVRCPEGRGKPCFFQKKVMAGSPKAIKPVEIAEEDGDVVDYMQIHDMPGLVALAQLGTLEIHTWGARADKPEKPDLAVFDLDPDVGLDWEKVALGAFELRRRLNDLGLKSFLKTTGGKGLHVVVPVERRLGWDEFKDFTKLVVEQLEHDEPDKFTTNMAKKARKGKIFLDYLRNGRNATFIAPYSPRAARRSGRRPDHVGETRARRRSAQLHDANGSPPSCGGCRGSVEGHVDRQTVDHRRHVARTRSERTPMMQRTNDPGVIEHRLLELAYTTDTRITAPVLAYYAGCSIEDAEKVLDNLVARDRIAMEITDDGTIEYQIADRQRLKPRDEGPAQPVNHALTRIQPEPLALRHNREANPGLAAVLSLFMPGAGQLYAGRIVGALMWFLAVSAGYYLLLPGLILHVFCIVSAASSAHRLNSAVARLQLRHGTL